MTEPDSENPSKLIELCDRAIEAPDEESRVSAIREILTYFARRREKCEELKRAAAT